MARQTSPSEDRKFVTELAGLMSVDATGVLEWVASIFSPEDVFSSDDLEDWARENGFVLKSDVEQE